LTEPSSSTEQGARTIHVVAAVLFDRRGRALIAQRPAGKHLAGCWEFPGGKIEPGETRTGALARELKEELGVEIEHPRPLLRLRHAYPFGKVLLDVWVVRRYRGEPRGLDGQALRWCKRRELRDAELLPADRPILEALRLPERLRRTQTPFYALRDFREGPSGDEKSGRDEQARCDSAAATRAHMAHRLDGAFCNEARDAEAAAAAGADFLAMRVQLSPAELAAVCGSVQVPVFARGTTLERAWAQGATGINAIEG
jgi:mutator protein MutT